MRLALPTVLLGALLLAAPSAHAQVDIPSVLAAAKSARLVTGEAHRVQSLRVAIPPAVLKIEDALVFAAEPIQGRAYELVLVGAAAMEFEPADAIEAHQLEVFAGESDFDEPLSKAVLVLNDIRVVDALLSRPSVVPTVQQVADAQGLFEAWTQSAERRLLKVETAIARGALSDPGAASYFAGWIEGDRLGRFIYNINPWRPDQVLLGQFVPLTLTKREARKARRYINKETRRMNLVGFEFEDLGVWNTWAEQSLRRDDEPRPGSSGFEPVHYDLKVELAPRDGEIAGTALITLRTDVFAGHAVNLLADAGVEIQEVRHLVDGQPSAPLETRSIAGQTVAFLEQAPAAGDTVELEIQFRSGSILARVAVSGIESFALSNTLHWYPHIGDFDIATYDLTVSWPQKFRSAGARSQDQRGEGGRWYAPGAMEGREANLGNVVRGWPLRVPRSAGGVYDCAASSRQDRHRSLGRL